MVADTEDKWAHPLCAAWIVEAYEVNRDGYPYLKLDSIIPQRYKLKCALCTKKGACAQCSFGRCTAAAHPWCVLHNPRGFKRRIVKGNEGEVLWEIFCRAHAKAVNEPIKPKHKSKLSQIGNANDERLSVADSGEFKVSKPIRNKSLSPEEIVAQVPSMDHARRTNAIDYLALGNYALDCESNRSSANVETDQYFSPKSGKRRDKISKSFPVFNLLEWPGQSEGEAMDLDHFWNVISMYYPEEHPAEVRT